MLFTAFDTNFTRVFAVGRIVLALLCLLFATTDPGGTGYQAEFDDDVVVVWLAIALVVAPLIWSNWWRDHLLFPWILLADLGAFVLVPWYVEPQMLAYFVVAPLIAAHLVVLSAVYKGFGFATGVAILLNFVCIDICIIHSFDPTGMPLADSARRIVLLLFVTLLMLWMCRNQLQGPIGRIEEFSAPNREMALDHSLAFAMDEGRADGAIAVWNCGTSQETVIRGIGSLQPIAPQTGADEARLKDSPSEMPTLFDLVSGHGLGLDRKGNIASVPLTAPTFAALRDSEVSSGICANLHGATGDGWLILTNVASLSRFDLNRIEAIAERIADSMDRHEANETSQKLAIARLREAVARDLHDGVAQSLAGARYWLQALRGKLANGVDAIDDLDRFSDALESEHTHVRELIDNMRREQVPKTCDLSDALSEMAMRQTQHWRAGVRFVPAAAPIPVDRELSFEIKQILRECIANSVRHGGADQITIRMRSADDGLIFAVEDNGSGFAASKPVTLPRTINERVASLGGMVQARSGLKATLIEFSIPMGKVH